MWRRWGLCKCSCTYMQYTVIVLACVTDNDCLLLLVTYMYKCEHSAWNVYQLVLIVSGSRI